MTWACDAVVQWDDFYIFKLTFLAHVNFIPHKHRDASEELGLPEVITTALYRRIAALLLPREYISQPCIH